MSRAYKSERHAALEMDYQSACNQNCNQGRMCDCVPNIPDLPLTRSDWTLATVIVACCAIPIVLGPMALAFFARVFA